MGLDQELRDFLHLQSPYVRLSPQTALSSAAGNMPIPRECIRKASDVRERWRIIRCVVAFGVPSMLRWDSQSLMPQPQRLVVVPVNSSPG